MKNFKIEIGDVFKDDKRDLVIIDRKIVKNKNGKNLRYYKYKCNKCGYECGEHYKNGIYHKEYWILGTSLSKNKGHGCACCCSNSKIIISGINDIPTTAPWMVKYFQNPEEAKLYTKSSGQKIKVKCPDCGRIKEKSISIYSIYKNHSIGCICSDGQSYPFKFMITILQQLNIKFKTEYSPTWIKPKRYDFYFELDGQKYIIETDGDWHNKDNNLSGQSKEESKFIDNYKDLKAKEHNIKVIRIDCKESTLEWIKKHIIDSQLNDIFDLSKINWLKCEEFALSNLCKKICEVKRDNPDFTATQIGKIMNLSTVTIIKYLKKGSKIWDWCDYNPKEERKKNIKKIGKLNEKSVEIFNKDGISLGKFPSATELERQSQKIFGIKLLQSKISLVCNKKRKQYKNFTFKYF